MPSRCFRKGKAELPADQRHHTVVHLEVSMGGASAPQPCDMEGALGPPHQLRGGLARHYR
eukprot:6986383-Pyramimonas_sp.AAC.1